MPTKYNKQFKDDVLAFYAAHPEVSKVDISKDFGVCYKTLLNWTSEAKPNVLSESGTLLSIEEQRKQQKRILLLEQENTILRKAAALFAQEVAPKGNTLSS